MTTLSLLPTPERSPHFEHHASMPMVALPNSLAEAAQVWQLGPMGEWFHQVVLADRLAHGWVFRCVDTARSYALALVLAKVLNCETPSEKAHACGHCRNCRWIDGNAHPAVMTLSPRTMLVKEDSNDWPTLLRKKGGKTQKNIHATQVGFLEQQLAYRSEATRLVILTDADLVQEATGLLPPAPHELADVLGEDGHLSDHAFVPLPLSRRALDDNPTNKLLKTLEEPPGNCIFVFLTTHEDQLLETIVSRCQLLPLGAPAAPPRMLPTPLAELLTQWTHGNGLGPRDNVDDHFQALMGAAGDDPDWPSVLTVWQQQLYNQWQAQSRESALQASKASFDQLLTRLQALENTRQQLQAYVSPETAFRHLLFTLCHELG